MPTRTFLLAAGALAAAVLPAAAATGDRSPIRGAVMFWLLDRNGNGAIERREIEELRGVVFDVLDIDGDGNVTREEVREVGSTMRARIADKVAAAIKADPQQHIEKLRKIMAELGLDDADRVARTAFVGKQAKLFAKADADADGRISKDEFQAMDGLFGGALTTDE
jgi:hypothetical protein